MNYLPPRLYFQDLIRSLKKYGQMDIPKVPSGLNLIGSIDSHKSAVLKAQVKYNAKKIDVNCCVDTGCYMCVLSPKIITKLGEELEYTESFNHVLDGLERSSKFNFILSFKGISYETPIQAYLPQHRFNFPYDMILGTNFIESWGRFEMNFHEMSFELKS